MNNRAKRLASGLSAAVMLFLSACGGSGDSSVLDIDNSYPAEVNSPVNDDTRWIISLVDGAIDETLSVSEKDDFYTAVNKDWILSQTVSDENECVWFAQTGADAIKQRKIDLLSGKIAPADSFEGLELSELAHDQELIMQFSAAAADWAKRNEQGVEPLRKYIEAIESISTLEEMTAYLADISGDNLTGECFVDISVQTGLVDQFKHRVLISPNESYLLEGAEAYKNIGIAELSARDSSTEIVSAVLCQLGYSEERAGELLRKTYELEGHLADRDETIVSPVLVMDRVREGVSLEDLIACCGDFPILEILTARGMERAEEYRVCSKSNLRYLGRMYTEANLEAMKAFLLTHTAKTAATLLTRALYEQYSNINETTENKEDKGTGITDAENTDEWDIILNDYVTPYMGGAMDIVYVARFCNSEQKRIILELTDDILEAYHDLINDEEWMSLTAREATIEKLDYMTVRAVYPDSFESYMGLSFDENDTLLELVQKINCDNIARDADLIDKPVDKSRWDMDEMSTTQVNAYYSTTENSINITAGILESETVFSLEQSREERLATIGMIIGHEITHAFDTNGSKYDKYGVENSWWDLDDTTAFQLRTAELMNYYSDQQAYPDGPRIVGATVSGEAIADMGGMKAGLYVARGIESFDYDLYFRSFAGLWRMKATFDYAKRVVKGDIHPINNLRTNVTLMQFDEFYDTYGITEGDGMYMPVDKRIAVW